MTSSSEQRLTPSIARALDGLPEAYKRLVEERYHRLLPVLLILMRPRDILERNRAWPGTRPTGKAATTYRIPSEASRARDIIDAYAAGLQEDANEIWLLFWAYCRYGPIGLIGSLPANLPPIISEEIRAFVEFHRLGKHPVTVQVGDLNT